MPSTVEITPKGRDFIKKGHVWIFANEFVTKMRELVKGSWVNFECRGEFIGYGYVNANSLIAGRVCSREHLETVAPKGAPPEFKFVSRDRAKLIFELIDKSLERRKMTQVWTEKNARTASLIPIGSFRAVYAESDMLPGLIVDVYKNSRNRKTTVVALSSTAGMDDAKQDIQSAIMEIFNPDEFIFRGDSAIRGLEGVENFKTPVKGEVGPIKDGIVEEDGVFFSADFIDGQKTGFFIDQRENRQEFKKLIKEMKSRHPEQQIKVLDLCSYSGGWGLSALAAGADHVTFVDQSADAIELCKKGMELNNFSLTKATFAKKDVFEFLATQASPQFDFVVCDPPAFVKSKKNLTQAEQAYFKMNVAAIKVTKQYLFTCSCSFHISDSTFTEIVSEAFQNRGTEAQVVFRGSQSSDHPWILNRPESRYLKCLGLKVVNK